MHIFASNLTHELEFWKIILENKIPFEYPVFNFSEKVAIVSLYPDLLCFHLSGIFGKQVDVSRQYRIERCSPGTLCWHIAQKHIMLPFAETLSETGRDAPEPGSCCEISERFRNSETRLFRLTGNEPLRR